MADRTTALARRAPRSTRIRSVVVAGVGTYRRRFWRIVFAAFVVFAPIDVIVTLATEAGRIAARHEDVVGVIAWGASSAVSYAGTILSLVFFAGVIDRIVAVDQYGHSEAPLVAVVRGLPTARLIVAGFLSSALVLAGLAALVIPGLLLMILFSVVGPVIVIEGLGPVAALRRSARLVWPHPWLTAVVILLPTVLEEELSSWLEHFTWYEHPLVHLPFDVASTIFVGGFIGVLEVTLAYSLIGDRRRRDAERAARKLARAAEKEGATEASETGDRFGPACSEIE